MKYIQRMACVEAYQWRGNNFSEMHFITAHRNFGSVEFHYHIDGHTSCQLHRRNALKGDESWVLELGEYIVFDNSNHPFIMGEEAFRLNYAPAESYTD